MTISRMIQSFSESVVESWELCAIGAQMGLHVGDGPEFPVLFDFNPKGVF
ncbi:hypothetical protein PAXRUDRAFT_22757 [Paxillus rubicundulus Ve08.2h10]|uniref:Uncharacterized protein n=1 Tax=Paxillus rubicundulus Ve08.2h10 TaxID=930991 RepID=A0A0D0BJK6_9AGAM|nr:hypothetical protein PAXRUDRAFT_22757 [Paxillus rubicundulus Ve08.2h10]